MSIDSLQTPKRDPKSEENCQDFRVLKKPSQKSLRPPFFQREGSPRQASARDFAFPCRKKGSFLLFKNLKGYRKLETRLGPGKLFKDGLGLRDQMRRNGRLDHVESFECSA